MNHIHHLWFYRKSSTNPSKGNSQEKIKLATPRAQLFKSFEFENGSRMSDKKLVKLEVKYLQNKKWYKQAVKSTRIRKSYTTYYFHFTQITEKFFAMPLQKLAIFNIYHNFAPFVKLCGCWLFYFFSLCDVRNEAAFLIREHSSFRGLNRKKHKKKHDILALKPLLQEIQLKNLTIRKIFWSSNI